MITKATVDRIMEATDIVEVIGEFVQLKKRGANYIGLSPFANERTPSFTVSPAKGIFKDFSTGKGGSAVTFLMELEKFSYPEALKWLAKKYSIEVEETQTAPEDTAVNQKLESLRIVSSYANKFFQSSLWDTEEGQAIGLSYFKERGFSNETIRKFELGYSPDQWEAFSVQAIKDGYLEEFIIESGLSVKRDNGKLYDRYRGRIIFPIHSVSGKVIAFGGRTLKTDKNVPKYVNSPETEIYHKSNVLYGWHLATKEIRAKDVCYLVEGYADVVSVHQAGIENVVASSGTSLTVEQVKLISRLTKNVVILYDGDSAGIKAALRGMSLLYKDRLNVKVVNFPDGHDPDSYVKAFGSSGFESHVTNAAKGIIEFYLTTIQDDELRDPIKKIKLADDLAEMLSNNLESDFRQAYTKTVSSRLRVDEQNFISRVNKLVLAKYNKEFGQTKPEVVEEDGPDMDALYGIEPTTPKLTNDDSLLLYSEETQEKEIIRLLLLYGNKMIDWDGITNTYIGPFMIAELSDVEFDHPACKQFMNIYKSEIDNGRLPDEQFFIHYLEKQIVDLAVDMISTRYSLSDNWLDMHSIFVPGEELKLRAAVLGAIFHLKKQKVGKILNKLLADLQTTTSETDQEILQSQYIFMKKVEKKITEYFGTVISK